MYPGFFAQLTPNKAAAILATTGQTLTYRQLDEQSNRLARYFFNCGLRRGDHVSIFSDNVLTFFEVVWSALRSGLYITTINRYLTADEVAYLVNDNASKAIVVSGALADVATDLTPLIPDCSIRLMMGTCIENWSPYEDTLRRIDSIPLDDQWVGGAMLYSSGTTGRPKGIVRELPEIRYTDLPPPAGEASPPYWFDQNTIYLSPAPLYHAAPFGFTVAIQRLGGTVVVMPRFDALNALEFIERYSVTHSQWVPTMFVRMLKLPERDRHQHDLSSHQCAIHAAAPCPVDVKRRMIEWWGPIIEEYYAGTEGNGTTRISSNEWMAHPGSVGKNASGLVHICDDSGAELPPREPGIVYFEQEHVGYRYHNAPEKNREVRHPEHVNWTTLGDVGYLDEEGYLYLTDRRNFMIVSGGVNIYPQEIENAYILHPKVLDVAVFGVPNEDFGEEVKAVIQLSDGVEQSPDVAQELMNYGRKRIAHYMVPKSIDFIDEMPRLPTGKLYKRILRDRYWGKHDSQII